MRSRVPFLSDSGMPLRTYHLFDMTLVTRPFSDRNALL